MTDEEFIQILPIVKAWITDFESRIETLLKAGVTLPGVTLVPKRPIRRWVSEDSVRACLGHILTQDQLAPRVLASPAQLEKTLKTLGVSPEVTKPLTVSESSGVTLKYL